MADLTPILNWFEAKGWGPFDFQREVWAAYLNGQRGGAEYEKLLMQPGMGTSFIDAQSMIHLYIVAMIAVVSIWSIGRRVKGR